MGSNCRVLPKDIRKPQETNGRITFSEKHLVKPFEKVIFMLGAIIVSLLFTSALFVVIAFIIGGALQPNEYVKVIVVITATTAMIVLITVTLVIYKIVKGFYEDMLRKMAQEKFRAEWQREKETAYNQAIVRATNEANSLTNQVLNIHNSSTQLAAELRRHYDQASSLLDTAEYEFKSNAFSPFWDAIEEAAGHLAEFNNKTKQLSTNADNYYRSLSGTKHTFPVFPVHLNTIPDSASLAKKFHGLVRKGQTDFQFANIWEHRRTRQVMIAGFRTLGEAVSNLGRTIEDSVWDLQRSISSDLAKVVEEEIKTRDRLDKRMLEQNRMLDNIQHHREPDILDKPSKF